MTRRLLLSLVFLACDGSADAPLFNPEAGMSLPDATLPDAGAEAALPDAGTDVVAGTDATFPDTGAESSSDASDCPGVIVDHPRTHSKRCVFSVSTPQGVTHPEAIATCQASGWVICGWQESWLTYQQGYQPPGACLGWVASNNVCGNDAGLVHHTAYVSQAALGPGCEIAGSASSSSGGSTWSCYPDSTKLFAVWCCRD